MIVRGALGTLPPAQAEVVRLRDVEGLPSVHVSQLLNLTEGQPARIAPHRAIEDPRRARNARPRPGTSDQRFATAMLSRPATPTT